MRRLTVGLCLILAVMVAGEARPTDRTAIAIEGAYLLLQTDGFQRILTFDRSGNLSQVSDQQTLIGFSVGQGTWEQTAPGKVRARLIDFSFEIESGKRSGPSLIDYELTFSDPDSGRYGKVSGSYTGKNFDVGQNPLNPSEAPTRPFGIDFEGYRITVD